jgi:hypothetical protein
MASRLSRNGALALMAICMSHSFAVVAASGFRTAIPALLTRIFNCPKCVMISPIIFAGVLASGGVATGMITGTRPDLDVSVLPAPEEIADIVLFLLTHRGNAVIDKVNVRRSTKSPWT